MTSGASVSGFAGGRKPTSFNLNNAMSASSSVAVMPLPSDGVALEEPVRRHGPPLRCNGTTCRYRKGAQVELDRTADSSIHPSGGHVDCNRGTHQATGRNA